MGSTAFAILLATIGWTVNLWHLAICLSMYGIDGENPKWLFLPCFGVWILIFGLLSIECSQLPASTTRRLFVVEVPIRYYPLALLVLFSLFGGFQLSYVLSIVIGYAYQQGKLDKLKVDPGRIQSWEQSTVLEGYVRQQGWITNDASSRGDWSEAAAAAGSTGANLFSRLLPRPEQVLGGRPAAGPSAGRVIQTGMASSTGSGNESFSFPTTGGRQLGTASRRVSPIDPRQARLDALEKRMGAQNDDDEGV